MWRDSAFLLDMLVAAKRAVRYVEPISKEAFLGSDLHQDAVVRALAVIGEAAARITSEVRDAYPEIPWIEIIGMRNRLIHEYFRADLERVWETVIKDIPVLIEILQKIVPPD